MTEDADGGTLHLPGWGSDMSAMPRAVPGVRTALRFSPSIREVFSCRFPEAALPPEFSKRRPVIVVSWKNSLTGPILVVPISATSQFGNEWAVKLARNPSAGETCDVWAVCNHLYTVSCARLTSTHRAVPRLRVDEFRPIHELVLKWVPMLAPL